MPAGRALGHRFHEDGIIDSHGGHGRPPTNGPGLGRAQHHHPVRKVQHPAGDAPQPGAAVIGAMQHAAMHLINDGYAQKTRQQHESAVTHHADRAHRTVDVRHHRAAFGLGLFQAACKFEVIDHQPTQLRPGTLFFGAPSDLEIIQPDRQMLRDFFQNQHVTRNPAHQAARGPGGNHDGWRICHETPSVRSAAPPARHRVTE